MNIKEALLQFLNEKSLGLSKQEIEKILHDELEKPESEIDCEIIDMCIELLAEIEHIPLPDDNIPVPPAPPIVHPAKKKRRWKAVLLVAAIFVVFVSATLLSRLRFSILTSCIMSLNSFLITYLWIMMRPASRQGVICRRHGSAEGIGVQRHFPCPFTGRVFEWRANPGGVSGNRSFEECENLRI